MPEMGGEEGEVEMQVCFGVVRVLAGEQSECRGGTEQGFPCWIAGCLLVIFIVVCFCGGFRIFAGVLIRVAVADEIL